MSKAIARFKALSPVAQAAVVAATAWNLTLTARAEWDIAHRDDDQIKGSRTLWRLFCLTNSVGPLSYFRWGRR